MKQPADKVDILVVDDRPDNLVAISAGLDRLGENVVTARSGRDALRHVLGQTFAVILLDINMPGMDGFETAELIRQYRPARRTPIIFLTAAGDDALISRSYELGAVDYLMTPVVPEVLRGKVRVFADLHRKTAEVLRQAVALAEQAAQLERLAAASIALSSARSLTAIVQAIADAARRVVSAHQAVITVTVHPGVTESAISLSERYADLRGHRPDRSAEALYLAVRPGGGAARLTQREIDADAGLRTAAEEAGLPPRRGLLAAPLTEADGRLMGVVQISDKNEGEFTEADEAALVQLLQLGAVAIQNCLHAEAREANRLKDEFLAILSHELRTPLQALLGWTSLLRAGTPDPVRTARGLEVIERNVRLQTSLIDELLDVSRIAAGKLQIEARPIPLAPVVESAADMLRPAAEARGIELHATIDERVGCVHGDAARLHQVFFNLIGNAVKFTAKGGRVDVVVGRWRGDVEVQVGDTGMGIRPEFLPFVFDRFRQGDSSITRAHGGLGLGLSVVKHLVELHRGSVRAESPGPGQGSTFFVRLPALGDGASAPEAAPPPEIAPVSGVQTLDGVGVVVVDDAVDARDLLREVLQQRRAQVTTADSAREAIEPDELVAAEGPEPR